MTFWLFLFSIYSIQAQVNNQITNLTNTVLSSNQKINEPTLNQQSMVLANQNDGPLNPYACQLNPEFSKNPPKEKKEGWKVLFEVTYQNQNFNQEINPTAMGEGRNLREEYHAVILEYLKNHNLDINNYQFDPNSFNPLLNQIFGSVPSEYEALRDSFYLAKLKSAKNETELNQMMKQASDNLNDEQFKSFLASIADWAAYNDDRAEFIQKPGAALGAVTPFEQIMETGSGVCGDIHSMVAKFAEIRGWEAFTIGYALEGAQHVVSAVVDPKNPDKVTIVNYGTLTEREINDQTGLHLDPYQDGWNEIGIQYRLFKNNDGKMQQIGTLPTALRSFLQNLTKKQYELEKAMKENPFYSQNKVAVNFNKDVEKEQKDGDLVFKNINESIMVYNGKEDGNDIWGVAVSHDTYKKLYNEDGSLKRTNYFGTSLSNSFITFNNGPTPLENVFVYLNIKQGIIKNLYETDYFRFAGIVGYNFDAFVSFAPTEDGTYFSSADGSFDTFFQVLMEYQKENTNLQVAIKSDHTVGLKNQNIYTDFSTYPKNINPLVTNGVAVDVKLNQKLNPTTSLTASANGVISPMGNRILLSSGILKNNTSVGFSYQGGMGSVRLGNNNIKNINLLNYMGPDNVSLYVGQQFQTKRGQLSGSFSGSIGLTTKTPTPQPVGNVNLKINIGKPPKRR